MYFDKCSEMFSYNTNRVLNKFDTVTSYYYVLYLWAVSNNIPLITDCEAILSGIK